MKQVVYLKIPVNRNGFVDPVNVNWTRDKEDRLWKVLSKSKRTEVNWDALSKEFDVGVRFLQQQAYWLYERELEGLRFKLQQETALSSDTIKQNQRAESGMKKEDIFHSGKLSNASIPNKDRVQDDSYEDEKTGTSSGEDEDEDSISELQQGSVLLHKSRILSRAPPRFQDINDDSEDEELAHIQKSSDNNHLTTESSTSNLSCMYLTILIFTHLYVIIHKFWLWLSY